MILHIKNNNKIREKGQKKKRERDFIEKPGKEKKKMWEKRGKNKKREEINWEVLDRESVLVPHDR